MQEYGTADQPRARHYVQTTVLVAHRKIREHEITLAISRLLKYLARGLPRWPSKRYDQSEVTIGSQASTSA